MSTERKPRTEREIVDQTNRLARDFYAMMGYEVGPDYRFYDSDHPQAEMCWEMAVKAQDELTATDVDNALIELELA